MTSGLDTIRAFVAVNLSIETLKSIAVAQGELRQALKQSSASIRWVPHANMHQTVKFLGNIDVELVDGIGAALRSVAKDIAPFRVEAAGVGAFPQAARPRVIWVGLKDLGEGLVKLHKATETALEEIGFAREKRPFRTHVTLGRVKRGKCDLTESVTRYADQSFGISTIGDVVLYESRLHRSGAEYIARARVPLSGVEPPAPKSAPEPPPAANETDNRETPTTESDSQEESS